MYLFFSKTIIQIPHGRVETYDNKRQKKKSMFERLAHSNARRTWLCQKKYTLISNQHHTCESKMDKTGDPEARVLNSFD